MGIIIVGTPDDNTDKLLVGTRAAVWAEAMRADGVILSSDGWGNSDVDFANTAEQIEIRGIPVTGLKFSGTVGQFVVENDHLGEILDQLLEHVLEYPEDNQKETLMQLVKEYQD